MSKVKIITDLYADIPQVLCGEYDIDCVPFTMSFNGEESSAPFKAEELYDTMRKGVLVKPCAPSVAAYEKKFEEYAAQKNDIVYIACSSTVYNAYSVAMLAAKHVSEKYSGVKILCAYTKAIGGAQALIAAETAKYAALGHAAEEVFEYATKIAPCARSVVTSDTFEYLKRAGKVKASAALFGNLFGIKPIIVDGAMVKRVKGRQNALDMSVSILKHITDCDLCGLTDNKTIYITHADCSDAANYIAEKLGAEDPARQIILSGMNAAVGALYGPTAVGLFAFGKSVM